MIVDDQVKEINIIEEMIEWKELGIDIIGTAKNGKAGYEEALFLKPDIIITDVVMPGMDGITMIGKLRQEMPAIKPVFMSCFDDYKFVGQAIEHGAYGYVLKPILPGELMNTMSKVIAALKYEEKNLVLHMQEQKIKSSIAVLGENFLRNLLFGTYMDETAIIKQSEFMGLNIKGDWYAAAFIELEGENEDKILFQTVAVVEKLKEYYRGDDRVNFILTDLTHISVILTENDNSASNAKKTFIKELENVLSFVSSNFNLTVTAGIGAVTDKLTDICASYRKAQKSLPYKFYLGKSQVIDTEEVSFEFNNFNINLDSLNDSIRQIVFSGDEKLIDKLVDRFLVEKCSPDMLKNTCHIIIIVLQLVLLQMQQSLENILGPYGNIVEQISSKDNLPELIKWMKESLVYIIEHINNSNKIEIRDMALKMEDFINRNYFKQIMLQDVAENVFVSPSYANFIYKNVFRKTVHQYIEEVRIKRAAELLLEKADYKVLEIAEKVGYGNSSYFINVFRKMYGCTPAEFRKRSIVC